MLFDTHIHFFPDDLAPKALKRLTGVCGFPAYTDGTRAGTQAKLQEWGCVGGIALHIATNPRQQQDVNRFAAAAQGENLLCFGSVHPQSPQIAQDVRDIAALGLRGIKLHPDYQDFFVDDAALFPLYAAAEKAGLPIAFHAGRDPLSPDVVHCTPKALAGVAKAFPALKVIAAHMGGACLEEEVKNHLAGLPNVWFDTAFISAFLSPSQFASLVKILGANRIFFGTDAPWATAPQICEVIDTASLSSQEKTQIYWKNAFSFFGLSEKHQLKPHPLG